MAEQANELNDSELDNVEEVEEKDGEKKERRSAGRSKPHVELKLYDKIERLISLGLDNQQVFASVCTDYPETIKDDADRKRAGEEKGFKITPLFVPKDKQRLEEYIRRVRHVYNNAKDSEAADDSICGRGQIASLDSLEADTVERLSTHNPEIDWLYDGTAVKDPKTKEILYKDYGLPRGKISLWAGERGVGKSRTSISISGTMNAKGEKVMVIQGEVALSEYKNWTDGVIKDSKHFWVSDQVHLADQLNSIKAMRPDLVIVDSINMIREARSASGLREILDSYRRVARLVNCHVILVGHLNKSGKVKGNNDLEYLVDIVVVIQKKDEGSAEFTLKIPNKNRYGVTGRCVEMMHTETSVTTLSNYSQADIAVARAAKMRAKKP